MTVYLLKNDELFKSIYTGTYGNYNNLAILRWNREHKDNKSRYETVLIPKNESVQILRRVGKTSDINSNFLRLSEQQAELEIGRLSLYLQGIAAGGFLVFILLSFTAQLIKLKNLINFSFMGLNRSTVYIVKRFGW